MTSGTVFIYKAVCILIVLTAVGIRVHLAGISFERDEGEYAYAGQLILKGDPPYKDVYNMKFPGTYYMYALSFKVFGESVKAPRYMVLLVQLSGAFFLFLLSRSVIHPLAGWLSASVFMLFNLSVAMQGLQSNAEHFVVVFFIASLYFLYRGTKNGRWYDILIAGALISLACIMKQHAVIFVVASLLWLVYAQRSEIFRDGTVYLAGFATPLALFFLYLWYEGVWAHFYFLTFQYAQAYGRLSAFPHIGFDQLHYIYDNAPILVWCCLISIPALLIPGKDLKARLFIILFLFSALAALSLGLYFRPHYFLYLMPVLALLFSYSAFKLTIYFNYAIRPVILSFYVAIIASVFFYINRECYFFMKYENVTELIYPNSPFNASRFVASYIMHHTSADARICMLGAEPQMFFLSKRRSASGYIYIYPLLELQKYSGRMTDEFIAQNEQAKPEILLYSSKSVFEDGANQDTRLYHWFSRFKLNYKLIALCYAKNDEAPMDIFDTIAPVDTFSAMVPQIKVYRRVDIK